MGCKLVEVLHLESRKRVGDVVTDPRDMYSSEIKVMLQCVECKVPYPGNFGSPGIDNLNNTLIVPLDVQWVPHKWHAIFVAYNSCQRMLMPGWPSC